MSNAKELEADRKKKPKYYPSIPDAKGYVSKQESYRVGYGNVREPMTDSERRLNVGKPNLRGKGEEQ